MSYTAIKKQAGKQSENQEVEDQHKGVTFMPYVKGVSDKICRFLKRAWVKTFHLDRPNWETFLATQRILSPRIMHHVCIVSLAVVVSNTLAKSSNP